KHRWLVPEGAIQRNLLGRVRDMVVAADDMRDRHRYIIGYYSHVVDGGSVGAQDDEIVQVTALPRNVAMYRVIPGDLGIGHRKADGVRHSCRFAARLLGRWEFVTGALEPERRAERLGLRAFDIELAGCEIILVRVSRGEQALRIGTMALGVGTLEERPFVPGDA